MKKRLSIFAIVGLMLSLGALSGCGESGGSTDSNHSDDDSLSSVLPPSTSTTSEEPIVLDKITETKVTTYAGPKLFNSSAICDISVNDTALFVYEVNTNPNREFSWNNKYNRNAVSYFDFEGRVTIKIDVHETVTNATVSPLAYGIVPRISGTTIEFEIDQANNYVIEYNDDSSKAIHLFANPLEKDLPDFNDPNVIYIGPGVYDAGAIPMTKGQTLYIAGGAYVYGNIRTEMVDNITIRGRGIISGEIYTRASEADFKVPLEVRGGKNIAVEGIIFLDPAGWVTTVYDCDGVTFDNVKMITSRPNGDGFSIQGSKNVTVKGGFVRTWDDSLVVKNNEGKTTQNILFDGVSVWTDLAQSMEVGFETNGAFMKDITFQNITVVHNFHKAAMSIHNADIAEITNVVYKNITIEDGQMKGDNQNDGENDYFVDLSIEYSIEWSENTNLGNVNGVTFENIKVIEIADSCVTRVQGFRGSNARVSNVTFKDIDYAGVEVASGDDINLVLGDLADQPTFIKGKATGRGAYEIYDLTQLTEQVTINTVETIDQDAVIVPDFAHLKGELPYLGDPVDFAVKESKVTRSSGKKFTSPVDDGELGSFDTTTHPVTNLFDGNRDTRFESKEYTNLVTDEFIAVQLDFEEAVYVGNLRLLSEEDNDYSFKNIIELRVLKEDGSNYVIASASGTYSISPTKGNSIDITFTAASIVGIQLRIFKSSDSNFAVNKVMFSEMELFSPSLSYKKPVVDATTHYDIYDTSRLTDGNPNGTSYYESDGFPAEIVIDLQDIFNVRMISLHLPSELTWDKRTQDIELLSSSENINYNENMNFTSFYRKSILFDPTMGNKELIDLGESPVSMRFLKIIIHSNDIAGGYGGQLSEVYVFGNK